MICVVFSLCLLISGSEVASSFGSNQSGSGHGQGSQCGTKTGNKRFLLMPHIEVFTEMMIDIVFDSFSSVWILLT